MVDDVTNTVETTTTDPSVGDKTQSTGEADTTESKTVPYERFAEVNNKAKDYESKVSAYEAKISEYEKQLASIKQPEIPTNPDHVAIKEALKQLGYAPQEEIRQEVEGILKQQKEDEALASRLQSLSSTYDGKDGRPQFKSQEVVKFALEKGIGDPEIAYEVMHKQALIDWHIQQAVSKSGGVRVEKSDGSGSALSGTTDSDLMKAATQGDQDARMTLIRRTGIFAKMTGKK